MAVCHHVGAGNTTWLLWKSHQSFVATEPFLQLQCIPLLACPVTALGLGGVYRTDVARVVPVASLGPRLKLDTCSTLTQRFFLSSFSPPFFLFTVAEYR